MKSVPNTALASITVQEEIPIFLLVLAQEFSLEFESFRLMKSTYPDGQEESMLRVKIIQESIFSTVLWSIKITLSPSSFFSACEANCFDCSDMSLLKWLALACEANGTC